MDRKLRETILKEPGKYSFFVDLIQLIDSGDDFVINTLELFAFGNISDYFKYQQFKQLDLDYVEQLLKLSIFDILSEHDGKVLRMEDLYTPDILKVLQVLGKEKIFVEWIVLNINSEAAQMVIDDLQGTIKVLRITKYRDVYDPQLYQMRILEGKSTIQLYEQQLKEWRQNIEEVKQEYGVKESQGE